MDGLDVNDLGGSPVGFVNGLATLAAAANADSLEHFKKTEAQTELALEPDRDIRKDEEATIWQLISHIRSINSLEDIPLLSISFSRWSEETSVPARED